MDIYIHNSTILMISAPIVDVKVYNGKWGGTGKMLSQTTEYALRAVVHLAGAGGASRTTQEIAEATRVPTGYLSKVLQSLGRAGFLDAQRGIGGGYVLARPPEEITVYDIVQAVEPIPRIRACPLGIEEHGTHLCPLHRRLDDAMAAVESAFRASTLAELAAGAEPGPALCAAPGR
jgi:Rrf2 family protein